MYGGPNQGSGVPYDNTTYQILVSPTQIEDTAGTYKLGFVT